MTASELAPDVCRLDQVATIDREGVAASAIKHGTTYVGLENIDSDGVFVGVRPVSAGELASNKFRFGPRHILFGKLRPYLRKTARPDFEGVCSTDIVPILPGPRVDRDYLFHFLRHPRTVEQAVMRCAGANLPRLSPKDLASFGVPVPGLSEQRRIADILDKADAIRRKRKQAIALTEELLRSAFLDMFGDPVTNPKGWPVTPLGEAADLHAGTTLPTGLEFTGQRGGYLLLKVGDMNTPGNESEIIAARAWASVVPSAAVVAPAGAVVIPKRGGAIATNKKRVLTRPAALDPNLMAIAPTRLVTLDYLRQWFEGIDLARLSNGSAVPQLNKKDLFPLALPVPEASVQARFTRVCDRARALREAGDTFLREAERLFASLVSRAFSGTANAEGAC